MPLLCRTLELSGVAEEVEDEEEDEEGPVFTPAGASASRAMMGAAALRAVGVAGAGLTRTAGDGMDKLPKESTDGGRPVSDVFIVIRQRPGKCRASGDINKNIS